jgi:hypothetical protein
MRQGSWARRAGRVWRLNESHVIPGADPDIYVIEFTV